MIINITNASRGTANAWHFYYALVLCDYGVMRKVSSSVVCPLSGRYKLWRL
ncbi:DUF3265 domain-containing protein [Vibrio anguillarum]|uniref:DUF3265 domain-containing protein n=1 Tax=Vibrio anguillarum TaxID=55601 RepID=A0AAW4BLT2_VIBAN|nr:DUF3265 domain-containing protein [Vibrio anguillarum]